MESQSVYMDLNERVHEIAIPSQLAGTRIDVANGRFVVYWAGPVPDVVHQLKDAASDDGVRLDVVSTPFSEGQLMTMAGELTGAVDVRVQPIMIEIATEGTGLTVHCEGLLAAWANPAGATPGQ